MFNQDFQRAVKTSIYIPRVDIQCRCVEADLCLAMQMWGLKLQARLESGEALAAKLVNPWEMHSQAYVCTHTYKWAQNETQFFCVLLVSDRM